MGCVEKKIKSEFNDLWLIFLDYVTYDIWIDLVRPTLYLHQLWYVNVTFWFLRICFISNWLLHFTKSLYSVGEMSITHRYTREIPDLLYGRVQWRPQPCGSNWGSSGFCQPHTQIQTQNKCANDLCRPRDAGDIRTWRTTVILITGKTRRPQFEHHAGIKMVQVLGISCVYLWYNYSKICPLPSVLTH